MAHYNLAIHYATTKPAYPRLANYHYQKAISLGASPSPEFEKTLQESSAKQAERPHCFQAERAALSKLRKASHVLSSPWLSMLLRTLCAQRKNRAAIGPYLHRSVKMYPEKAMFSTESPEHFHRLSTGNPPQNPHNLFMKISLQSCGIANIMYSIRAAVAAYAAEHESMR